MVKRHCGVSILSLFLTLWHTWSRVAFQDHYVPNCAGERSCSVKELAWEHRGLLVLHQAVPRYSCRIVPRCPETNVDETGGYPHSLMPRFKRTQMRSLVFCFFLEQCSTMFLNLHILVILNAYFYILVPSWTLYILYVTFMLFFIPFIYF